MKQNVQKIEPTKVKSKQLCVVANARVPLDKETMLYSLATQVSHTASKIK
ncbi:MAG: hypothetical protein LBT75_00120 [Bacilli bacterium]|jgi:hypothetical protein|nr:hypothetical protein [Bacilli bacterium]